MSTARRTPALRAPAAPSGVPQVPRVREQARDVLAVMAFSALASTLLAGALLLVVTVGR